MNACEYLARVGYDLILAEIGRTDPEWADEDDQAAVDAAAEDARLADMERVRQRLIDTEDRPMPRAADLNGARWMGRVITWPDRVPGLKTWAGLLTLPKIIEQRRTALRRSPERTDLLTWRTFPAVMEPGKKDRDAEAAEGTGQSGLDALTCQDAIDVGFSPNVLGIAVAYRPGLELLAVVGLESLPLVSYGPRECGFVHGGAAWRFKVEPRDGGYLYRWGQLKQVTHAEPLGRVPV